MENGVLIHWIELLASALAALFAGFAVYVKVQHDRHLADLREQLRREQEDRDREDKPPRSARATARKNHRD